MRKWPFFLALLSVCSCLPAAFAETAACADASGGLGVSRIVDIDTTAGPLYGDITKYAHEDSFLGPKEVVLTFDDGPIPWITKSVLDTLDKFCTKATFFSVGQMAVAYPEYSKEVIARGHTLGSHTWSHPMNLAHLPLEKAMDQIERGFAAVTLAAGQPIAPFFRFPGLNDSDPLLAQLQTRGIASFTVDVVSNDSYIANASRLTQKTLAAVEQHNGGIILFHDIKASTTKALPEILKELQARGYKVVHMRAKGTMTPVATYEPELSKALAKVTTRAAAVASASSRGDTRANAKTNATLSTHQLQPSIAKSASAEAPPPASNSTTATVAPAPADATAIPVTELVPAPRARLASANLGSSTQRLRHSRKAAADGDTSAGPAANDGPAPKPARHKYHRRHSDQVSFLPF